MNVLTVIADNPALTTALRELLEEEIAALPVSSEGFNDERLGQIARARIDGLTAIDRAFNQIAKLKTRPDNTPRVNRSK